MAEKTSFISILLGSAFVSAVVSIGYNHFFVTKKDLLERELNFITALHTIVKEQDERDEHGRLTFVTNVLHPIYKDDAQFASVIGYYMKAKTKTAAEVNGSIGNTLDAVLTRETSPIANSTVLDDLRNRDLIPKEYTTESLRDGLFSGYRRQLSDTLVAEIDKADTDLPKNLIEAIILKDPKREYRVNLYIAYTLARTVKWKAPKDSLKMLTSLKARANYQDHTFKKNLDGALKRYEP